VAFAESVNVVSEPSSQLGLWQMAGVPAVIVPVSGREDLRAGGTTSALGNSHLAGGKWLEWESLGDATHNRIDGISDQNLPYWNGSYSASPFAALFRNTWVSSPPSHIRYARYVVQWNVIANRGGSEQDKNYYNALSSWYADVREAGLIPVLAPTVYKGSPPTTSGAYRQAITELLNAFPAPYLEAWNEPNHTAGLTVAGAAHFMNEAYKACQTHSCTAIAGDFLDEPGSRRYAEEYKEALSATLYPREKNPPDWGIHPYGAINKGTTEALAIRHFLPAGDKLWITEAGAYYCEKAGATARVYGEGFNENEQGYDANRLVTAVIPALNPVHVFYYEVMYKYNRITPCASSEGASDSALYWSESDEPIFERPAAVVIFSG